MRGWGHVVDIATEEDRVDRSPPEVPQPACLDEITWPSGKTLQTSDS